MSRASNLAGFTTSITSTTNLSACIVTATSFVGSLTGTATGLSGSPNITVGNIMGFVMDIDDLLIALRKPSKGGDIESLGLKATNNYVNMWLNKDVFDENIKFNTLKYFYF